MPFVKLDCGILNSTLWFEREAREIFLTSLLMAEPQEFTEPIPQINVRNLDYTGWEAPPGWYGFVPAAGVGIIDRAKVEKEAGLDALELLGKPEDTSRSQDYDGRRMIRVDGGYLILNYMKYRERDYTSAERSRRYRERKAAQASHRDNGTSHRDITQAEAEVEVEAEVKADQERERAPAPQKPPVFTQSKPSSQPPGLINGAEMRRHGQHAWCDPVRALCVPAALHEQFQKNGLKSDADLKAWYQSTVASVEGKPVGGLFEFWRVSFENWVGVPVKKAQTGYLSKGDKVKQAVEGAIRIANARQQQN